MVFLSLVWFPWWLYAIVVVSLHLGLDAHHQATGHAMLLFGWLAGNLLVTLVYVVTRVFRKATADSRPRA